METVGGSTVLVVVTVPIPPALPAVVVVVVASLVRVTPRSFPQTPPMPRSARGHAPRRVW